MARPRETTIELKEISEREAHEQIRKTYTDPDAALKFFDSYVSQRQAALKGLQQQLERDPEMQRQFTRNPVELLEDRGLLGPLDELNLEGLRNPLFPLPWPLPRCRLVCRIECVPEVVWICVGVFGFRICWPTIRIRCRWNCRIVCSF